MLLEQCPCQSWCMRPTGDDVKPAPTVRGRHTPLQCSIASELGTTCRVQRCAGQPRVFNAIEQPMLSRPVCQAACGLRPGRARKEPPAPADAESGASCSRALREHAAGGLQRRAHAALDGETERLVAAGTVGACLGAPGWEAGTVASVCIPQVWVMSGSALRDTGYDPASKRGSATYRLPCPAQ